MQLPDSEDGNFFIEANTSSGVKMFVQFANEVSIQSLMADLNFSFLFRF